MHKVVDLYIISLKITAEDPWLKNYIEQWGDSVETSPQYKYLLGHPFDLQCWMDYRGLPIEHLASPLMVTLRSMIKEGQKNPILVYKDMRINTGHKRAACALFLGLKSIKSEFVEDDYKL